MASPELDPEYETERSIWVAIFAVLCAAFSAQVYSRTRSTTPPAPVFDLESSQAVNHLSGAFSALSAAIAWSNMSPTRQGASLAFYTFVGTCNWNVLANAFVLNASIAMRSMMAGGLLEQNQNSAGYKVWLVTFLAAPWTAALVAVITMMSLNRRWPTVLWVFPISMVLLTTTLRTLQMRLKLGSYLAEINNSRLVGNHPATGKMKRWKRFTQMGCALSSVSTFIAVIYIYMLLSGDIDTSLSNRAYTRGEGVIFSIFGAMHALLLLSMMWFSWVTPQFWLARMRPGKEQATTSSRITSVMIKTVEPSNLSTSDARDPNSV